MGPAQLGYFVFSGGGAIVLLIVAAAWATWSPRSRVARRVLAALALFYWLASTEVISENLRVLMAAPFEPLSRSAVPPGRTAIVLLGSGGYGALDWDGRQFAVSDRIGAARLLEAARVYHLVGADYIISSGGVGIVSENAQSAGVVMADALVSLGIPRDRIVVEDRSRNTRDEAVVIKEMLARRPVDQLVLVTSQFHMRRSLGTFRAVGLETIPAIAREPESFNAGRGWTKLLPSDKGLGETGLAAHEVMGIVVYTLRGWYR
ncbi:MAG: YdcF family protein [Vicinamibacterales bacterium]